jgi:uncharacterized protein
MKEVKVNTRVDNSQKYLDSLQAGDIEGLKRGLDEDPAAAEARDANGVSLLMHCLYRGRRDLAEMIAARKKQLDIFEAASLGRLDRLKQLVAEPAAANSHSKDGFTALHFAGFFGQPASARVLIDAGAVVDSVASNPMAVTPLHSSASARNLEAVKLLLEHGASPNARQHGGWAPIHSAAQNGDRAMVDVLLKHGADRKLANDEGKTAAMVARDKGHSELSALLE